VGETPSTLAQAREQFLGLVESVRPELHRYCARLTGSVIEGEDIVQETLAKAFYTMSQTLEVPPLRPWLFRIAHNTAIDFLRSRGRRQTEPSGEIDEIAAYDAAPDPLIVRAALARFLTLPLTQRSAVVLKDVLGHSLEEIARPWEIEIWVEGQPVEDLEKTCSDPRPQRYQVNFRLPEHVGPGLHHLNINIGHRKLPPVPIEVVV